MRSPERKNRRISKTEGADAITRRLLLLLYFDGLPIFPPEQPAAGLEEEPRVYALAAELEVHGQLFAEGTDSLTLFNGLAAGDGEGLQAVEVAAHPAAVVDDDGIAGEGEVPGEGHRAVCGGAGRVAGDGVELGGVRLGTLLAVRDLDLAEIEQNEVIFRRADEAAGPELFLRGLDRKSVV